MEDNEPKIGGQRKKKRWLTIGLNLRDGEERVKRVDERSMHCCSCARCSLSHQHHTHVEDVR